MAACTLHSYREREPSTKIVSTFIFVFRRIVRRLQMLWRLATRERATPREVALAIGLGAFVGATPLIGLHGWIAVGLATAVRLNRLYAFLGSRVSSPVVLPFIVLAEIQLAHRARCGAFIALTRADVLTHAKGMLLDWCLGTIPVGLAVGGALGAAGYAVTRMRLRARRSSSECPPSSSPARPS
jgi:uncharacterized protein (DUF2062 family)